MTKEVLLTRIAATITTLAETNGSPESTIYLAFGSNIHEWEILRDVLVKAGLVKISGNYVTLTAEGKVKAVQLEALIKKN